MQRRFRSSTFSPKEPKIERIWDKGEQRFTVQLLPGQRYVAEEEELLETVIGSGCCLCVRHRVSGISGMVSLLLASDVDALWCIEHCIFSLEDLTHRILQAADADTVAELDVWVAFGGDVGTLTEEDREFQMGVVSTILLDYGAPIVEMHQGKRRPLSIGFDPRAGRVKVRELLEFSVIGMRRDLECIERLQLEHERCLVNEASYVEIPSMGDFVAPIARQA